MGLINALPGALAQGLIWALLAIGIYITFKILDFADLTVDGSVCTGAAVCTILMVNGVNVFVALLVAFLAGMIAGLITGVLHVYMGIPPILSGILTQLMLWSINLKILGRANVALPSRGAFLVVSALNIPVSIGVALAFVAVFIVVLHFFFNTELGYSIVATGCNLDMSRAQGINVNLNKILGLMISNGIVALAGALIAQYQGFADINMGRGALVIGLAAIIIGQAIFSRVPKKLFLQLTGITLGSIIYYLIYTIIIQLGLDTDLLKMLSAIIVAIFLAIPYWKSKYSQKLKVRRNKKCSN